MKATIPCNRCVNKGVERLHKLLSVLQQHVKPGLTGAQALPVTRPVPRYDPGLLASAGASGRGQPPSPVGVSLLDPSISLGRQKVAPS